MKLRKMNCPANTLEADEAGKQYLQHQSSIYTVRPFGTQRSNKLWVVMHIAHNPIHRCKLRSIYSWTCTLPQHKWCQHCCNNMTTFKDSGERKLLFGPLNLSCQEIWYSVQFHHLIFHFTMCIWWQQCLLETFSVWGKLITLNRIHATVSIKI